MQHIHLRRFALATFSAVAAAGALVILLAVSSATTHASGLSSPLAAASSAPADARPLQVTAGGYTTYLPLVPHKYPPPIAYSYGFEDPGCDGWTIHYFNMAEPDPPGAWSAYCGKEWIDRYGNINNNGVYNIKTSAAWNTWIYTAPVTLADTRNFTIVLDGKSTQDFMWASSWGVYFNANADRTKFYSFQIYQTGVPDLGTPPQYALRRWINFRGTAIDDNDTLLFKRCPLCAQGDFQWNRVTIRRIGDNVYLYAGDSGYEWAYDYLLAVSTLSEYTSAEYNGVGVLQGNFEFMNWNGDNPAFQIDNFYAYPVYRR